MSFFAYHSFAVLFCDPFLILLFGILQSMTMMFEVQDLAVASPATVSRCGMVYLEPGILGLEPFVDCWLRKLPDLIYPFKDQLKDLFDKFMEVDECLLVWYFYPLCVLNTF